MAIMRKYRKNAVTNASCGVSLSKSECRDYAKEISEKWGASLNREDIEECWYPESQDIRYKEINDFLDKITGFGSDKENIMALVSSMVDNK